MRAGTLCLSLFFVLISGCAVAPEKQREQRLDLIKAANATLTSRDPCCVGFENAKIHGLWPKTLSKVRIDENSDIGVFGDQRSYFVGFELPADLPTRGLLIKEWYVVKPRDPHAPATILDSTSGPDSGYILKPFLAFLDSTHKLINEVSAPICFDQGWDRDRTGFFASALAPEGAKFAILFTRPFDPDAGISHQYSGGGGTVGFWYQYSGTMKMYFGPTGNIELGTVNGAQIESLKGSKDKECADVLKAWGYQFEKS